jgi:hypothetical protein
MATPSGPQISMLDMRAEITRGTGNISMSEVRTRYGGSGQINFSDLYKSEGFIVTVGSYSDKFTNQQGFSRHVFIYGSVNPDEAAGQIQFAANSFMRYLATGFGTQIQLGQTSNTAINMNGDLVTAGFKATDVTRIVISNTAYSIGNAVSNSTVSAATTSAEHTWSVNGTSAHCLVKF